ncbi:MAG: NAD(P)H-binding protein, partial [Mycobacteriales bacterium]
MRVVIAGGHGQIALRLERLLANRGDEPVGLIRNPDHAADLRAAGAEPVYLDLESCDVAAAAETLAGADAVVFAAGAGPGSGAERKDTVDRAAAVLLADAAETVGVRGYVMVSAYGADGYDPTSDDVFQVYLRAKSEADADLRRRDMDWTIVRPGGLSNDAGTGRVALGESIPAGKISRDDVAALLVQVLASPHTAGLQFEATAGSEPIADAV